MPAPSCLCEYVDRMRGHTHDIRCTGLVYPIQRRLTDRHVVQHQFETTVWSESRDWDHHHAALRGSSHYDLPSVLRWFSANIGMHHVHHLCSRIPFYRLPEVLKEMPELQKPKITTLTPRDIIRCLRLKVWDVERQCMVGVRGL